MPEPLDDAGLERLMRETRELIDSLRAGRVPAGDVPARGDGRTADERVRVTAREGRIETITLEPRLLRLPPEEFGSLVRDAVNAALGDLLGGAAAAAPDLAALSATLQQVQNEGLRQMAVITQGIEGAMARVRERTSISGDPTPRGLEQLLGLAQRNLDDALASAGEAADVRGEGTAARGRIHVTALAGRVESVAVGAPAMRMASHDLAAELVTAVNTAFDDLRARRGDERGAAAVPAEELTRRVREVQDMSLDQMRTYTRALRDIMTSIGDPE